MGFTFLDRELVCKDCGEAFVWSAGEQEFYAVMGFDNDPARCPACRRQRRYGNRRPPQKYRIVCSGCGEIATVPFRPRPGRAVYCRKCYHSKPKKPDVA